MSNAIIAPKTIASTTCDPLWSPSRKCPMLTRMVATGRLRVSINNPTGNAERIGMMMIGITGLIIPALILIISPIALMISISHTLNKLATDSEIIVMNAAGFSPLRLFLPFLYATVVVSLLGQLVLLPLFRSDSGGSAIMSLIGFSVVFVLQFVVAFFLQAGVYRAGLGVTRGIKPEVSMLTDTTHMANFALTVVLVGLGAFVGYLLCFIPGII